MDVRLEHMGDRHAQFLGLVHVVEWISLRINHYANFAVADQVATVAQAQGVEGHDGHGADPRDRSEVLH